MNPLSRCFGRSVSDSRYFNELERLSSSYSELNESEMEINDRIKDLFEQHSDSLIADLLANPDHRKNYRMIGANLRDCGLLHTFQASIGYVQKIAHLIENQDFEGLEKFSHQISKSQSNEVKLGTILCKFSSLKLPQDIEEIRAISHPTIRALVLAAIIDRESSYLSELKLSKKELMQIAPHLKYVNCESAFDNSWSKKEIYSFLNNCQNLNTLKIDSMLITELPPLPLCETLYLENCNLKQIPTLPRCKTLEMKYSTLWTELPPLPACVTLKLEQCSLPEIPSLPHCETLECQDCKGLTKIGSLPSCKVLDCSWCDALTEIGALPLCESLRCGRCPELRELPNLPSCRDGSALWYDSCLNLNLNSIPARLKTKERVISETQKIDFFNDDLLRTFLSNDVPTLYADMPPNVQFNMIEKIVLSQNYPALEFILDKMTPIDNDRLIRLLKLTEDPVSFEITFNKFPNLGKECSYDLLKIAVMDGRSIFVSEILNHGMQLTQEQFNELLPLTLKNYNLSMIKKIIEYAKIHEIQSPSYPQVLNLENVDDANLQHLLTSFALHSPLTDVYELVSESPKFNKLLGQVLQTISLVVRLPNREYARELNPGFADVEQYINQTKEYALQNKNFLNNLPPLSKMSREQFFNEVVKNRYERLPTKNNLYVTKQTKLNAFGGFLGLPQTPLDRRSGTPSRYHWSLRHLRGLLYNPAQKNWEVPKHRSMSTNVHGVEFNYAFNKKHNFPITKLENNIWLHNLWVFDQPEVLQNHLKELHKDILDYPLKMGILSNKNEFFEKVARGYWLTATLCEYQRGTPHNAMMWLNAIYKHHNLSPPIPKLEHFYLDNTMLMLPIETVIEKWSSFFEPTFQEYFAEKADIKIK